MKKIFKKKYFFFSHRFFRYQNEKKKFKFSNIKMKKYKNKNEIEHLVL